MQVITFSRYTHQFHKPLGFNFLSHMIIMSIVVRLYLIGRKNVYFTRLEQSNFFRTHISLSHAYTQFWSLDIYYLVLKINSSNIKVQINIACFKRMFNAVRKVILCYQSIAKLTLLHSIYFIQFFSKKMTPYETV